MKESIDLSGLTDRRQDQAEHAVRCRCGSLARMASGLCVSCLLRSALERTEPTDENFDAILAEADVPDRDWQLGNYRILEEIGRGGMGVIYRARHTPSRRVVALKRVLNYHSDSQETLARFQAEARAAASLDHPNILPIYDVGATEEGLPFFTMKFAVGGSLLAAKDAFRDSPRRAAKLVSKVAWAIHHAHAEGILHRDLKPGNILLDARGEPMVSDFGLAKWLENGSDLTRTLTVFGTPGYIAPEQTAQAPVDLTAATDIYSLGAILFELLSGRPPFLGEHVIAVLRQAAEKDAPRLRSIVPKASRDLETICTRCLERDPQLRYSSAAALAEDLNHWLEGRAITARPISPLARLYRWARRNPLLTGSIAISLLCAAAGITHQFTNWRLEKEVREAELAKNSVAVLPFLDLDKGVERSDLSVEATASLQHALSAIGEARVTFSKRSGNAKTLARESKTRSVLFGATRKAEHGTRLSVQLLAADGDPLFNEHIEMSDPDDVATAMRALAPRLFAVLSASDWSDLIRGKSDPAMRNEQARELLTAGRELTFHLTTRDLDRAISCFEKAIQLEPRSALAHAYLASAAAGRTHYIADEKLLAYAESEVEQATALAADSPEVLRVLAGVKYQRGQFEQALEDGLRAVEICAPEGKSVAMVALAWQGLGRPDQALRWFELARRLDPRPGEYDCRIGDCWVELGDFERARTAYQRANALHPERSQGLIGMSHIYLLNADFSQARSLCRQSTRLNPDGDENAQLAAQIEFFARNFPEAKKIYTVLHRNDPNGGGAFHGAISYKSALGRLGSDGRSSKSAEALLTDSLAAELKDLRGSPANRDILYRVAALESSLGHTEQAIAHLEAAAATGWIDYRSLSLDPRFDNIGDDARFHAILGRIKIKTEDLQRRTRDF